jgi:hypothetical protein
MKLSRGNVETLIEHLEDFIIQLEERLDECDLITTPVEEAYIAEVLLRSGR